MPKEISERYTEVTFDELLADAMQRARFMRAECRRRRRRQSGALPSDQPPSVRSQTDDRFLLPVARPQT